VSVFVASGDVVIVPVGDGTGYDVIGNEASGFYSTNVVKTFDVSPSNSVDNQYGTDGYYVFGGTTANNSADYNTANAFVASIPTFVDSVSADTSVTLARVNSSQVPMDNPAAAVNGTDFALTGYLMNNGTDGTNDIPMMSFSVLDSEALTFRLGVIAGHLGGEQYDPSALRLSFQDGTTTNVTALEYFEGTVASNDIGMVFFDVIMGEGTTGTFTILASENSNNATIGGLTFDVIQHSAIVAFSQNLTTFPDTPLDITLTGYSVGASNLTYAVVNTPSNGLFDASALPNVVYTPTNGFVGTASFTFTVNDGVVTSQPATVTISVTNEVPTATAQALQTPLNTALEITLTGIDADNGPTNLIYSVATQPTNGTLSEISGQSVTYTPADGYMGFDSFTFLVNDGLTNSEPATISLTVTNDVPVAENQSVQALPDTALDITLTASDLDNGPSNLTYSVTVQPIHGTLSKISGQVVTYTPTNGYQGADSFLFTVFDGQATSEAATVSITVTNELPTATDIITTAIGTNSVEITLSGSDPEDSSLTYSVATLPSKGTLDTSLLPTVTYTANASASGADSFTYTVNDGWGSSAAATVSVFVVSGSVTISPAGNGSGYDVIGEEAAGFYTTSLVKLFDVSTNSIDNQYGTDGYYVFGGTTADNSADYNTAGKFAASIPTFVDSITADTDTTLVRVNSSQVAMDDPSAVTNGDDFAFSGYLMNSGTAGTNDLPMMQFLVADSEAISFRLGVIAGNEGTTDSRYDVTAIRLSFADGTTGNVTALEALSGTDPAEGIGMVFFDVTLSEGTSGTFTIAASEGSNNPTIGGITFDLGEGAPVIPNLGATVVIGGTGLVLSWDGAGTYNVLTNADLTNSEGWGVATNGTSPIELQFGSESELFYKLSD
jgi:hypothetical protein